MTTTEQKVKEIKQSFRQLMDGATAQSMRDKGLNYHLNWGVTLPRLRQMAEEISVECRDKSVEFATAPEPTAVANSKLYTLNSKPKDTALYTLNSEPKDTVLYTLSSTLWKENIRECKILATMLMPPDEILPEVVDIWMEQTPTLEIAEQAAFNLYQHLPYAADKAFQWLASPDDLPQICGYHVLSRLFMQKQEPNERGINEFIDQALAALQSPNVTLRKAAYNAILRFADLSLMHQRLASAALRRSGIDTE